VDRDV
jgi:hypothetical protein